MSSTPPINNFFDSAVLARIKTTTEDGKTDLLARILSAVSLPKTAESLVNSSPQLCAQLMDLSYPYRDEAPLGETVRATMAVFCRCRLYGKPGTILEENMTIKCQDGDVKVNQVFLEFSSPFFSNAIAFSAKARKDTKDDGDVNVRKMPGMDVRIFELIYAFWQSGGVLRADIDVAILITLYEDAEMIVDSKLLNAVAEDLSKKNLTSSSLQMVLNWARSRLNGSDSVTRMPAHTQIEKIALDCLENFLSNNGLRGNLLRSVLTPVRLFIPLSHAHILSEKDSSMKGLAQLMRPLIGGVTVNGRSDCFDDEISRLELFNLLEEPEYTIKRVLLRGRYGSEYLSDQLKLTRERIPSVTQFEMLDDSVSTEQIKAVFQDEEIDVVQMDCNTIVTRANHQAEAHATWATDVNDDLDWGKDSPAPITQEHLAELIAEVEGGEVNRLHRVCTVLCSEKTIMNLVAHAPNVICSLIVFRHSNSGLKIGGDAKSSIDGLLNQCHQSGLFRHVLDEDLPIKCANNTISLVNRGAWVYLCPERRNKIINVAPGDALDLSEYSKGTIISFDRYIRGRDTYLNNSTVEELANLWGLARQMKATTLREGIETFLRDHRKLTPPKDLKSVKTAVKRLKANGYPTKSTRSLRRRLTVKYLESIEGVTCDATGQPRLLLPVNQLELLLSDPTKLVREVAKGVIVEQEAEIGQFMLFCALHPKETEGLKTVCVPLVEKSAEIQPWANALNTLMTDVKHIAHLAIVAKRAYYDNKWSDVSGNIPGLLDAIDSELAAKQLNTFQILWPPIEAVSLNFNLQCEWRPFVNDLRKHDIKFVIDERFQLRTGYDSRLGQSEAAEWFPHLKWVGEDENPGVPHNHLKLKEPLTD
jgi:hypothetical protein